MSEQNDITVSQAVWPWRRKTAAGAQEKSASHRGRAAIEGCVMAGIGALLLRFAPGHGKWVGVFALSMAGLTLLGGFAVPPLYAAIRRFGALLGRGAGVAFSWLLLVPFFYLVFPAARLVLVLRGKDPLHRTFDPAMKSYWSERPRPAEAARYTRQY